MKTGAPFKPSALLVEVRDAFAVKGLSVLGRAAASIEAFERGAAQRALLEGLPLPPEVVRRLANVERLAQSWETEADADEAAAAMSDKDSECELLARAERYRGRAAELRKALE